MTDVNHLCLKPIIGAPTDVSACRHFRRRGSSTRACEPTVWRQGFAFCPYNRRVKRDRTLRFLALSVLIFLFSLLLPPFSVHTYCEHRTWAGIFGIIAVVIFGMHLRNRAASIGRKIMSAVALTLCLLAVAIDVAFIVYATRVCRHMFDQLH